MTELVELVNIEALTATYLRDLNIRARATAPDQDHRVDPWVEITLINAPSPEDVPVDWLVDYMLDFGCYAGEEGNAGAGQPGAHALVHEVRAALSVLPNTVNEYGVVTAVKMLAMPRVPDNDMEPARERYVLTARITAHPKRGS